ncbi:MAG: rod shape-determining protein MreD [Candidatus Pelagadaptatus aseana]|uniref:rod shape-determining protein MreD n=1 Tax=Candidatus Pelagadaptatus aseana TaxID=3120508 RepID=UPI0039B28FA0
MALIKAHNRWVIPLTYIVALLLCVFPLVYEGRWLRPEFLALVVIFWVVRMPQQVSMTLILAMACLQDLLEGGHLGQHGLALVAVAYLALLLEARIKHYVMWQQALVVLFMVMAHQLVDNWVHSFQGGAAANLEFLMPAFTSAMIWPLVQMGMERLRLRLRVS